MTRGDKGTHTWITGEKKEKTKKKEIQVGIRGNTKRTHAQTLT